MCVVEGCVWWKGVCGGRVCVEEGCVWRKGVCREGVVGGG